MARLKNLLGGELKYSKTKASGFHILIIISQSIL